VGVLLSLWGAAALVVPRWIGEERVRTELVRVISLALGHPVSVDKASISLWAGPRLRFAGVGIGPPSGQNSENGWVVRAERGSIRIAVLPMLFGDLKARSIVVEGGSVSRGGRLLASDFGVTGRVRRESSGTVLCEVTMDGLAGTPVGQRRLRGRVSASFDGGVLRVESADVSLGIVRAVGSGNLRGLDSQAPQARFDGEVAIGATRSEGTLEVDWREDATEIRFDLASNFADFDEILSLARRERHGGSSAGAWISVAHAEPDRKLRGWAEGLRVDGSFRAVRGRLYGVTVEELRTPVEVRKANLQVEGFSCRLHGGVADGSIRLDLGDSRFPFRLGVAIDGVRMESLEQEVAPDRGGVLKGTGRMKLDLDGLLGQQPLAPTLRGTLVLAVDRGSLTSVGLMKQAASFLEMAGAAGIGSDETAFERMMATFEIERSDARTDDLHFRSEDLDLDGGGTIGLDGRLRLDVRAAFSADASRRMVETTPRLSFRMGPDGRLTVPMKIRGTLDAPFVQIDLEKVLEEGLEKELRERGEKGLLRRLLGR
jgi:hypothetical protein